MQKQQVEMWVIRLCDQVKAGQQVEDTRAELKADLIDPVKLARRIAGMCNAAGAEPCIVVLGADEKSGIRGVQSSDHDIADWQSQCFAEFVEKHPAVLEHVATSIDGKTVHGIVLASDEAPYLVKNPSYGTKDGGPVRSEVPWRELTSVRTATRRDMLRILVPTLNLPDIDVVHGTFTVQRGQLHHAQRKDDARRSFWHLDVEFIMIPNSEHQIVLPLHRCAIVATLAGDSWAEQALFVDGKSFTVNSTTQIDVSILRPTRIRLVAHQNKDDIREAAGARLRLGIVLQPSGARNVIRLTPDVVEAQPQGNEVGRWALVPDFLQDEVHKSAVQSL